MGLAVVCGFAAADEAPEVSFELDSLTRKFTKKKAGEIVWSNDAQITINLKVSATGESEVVGVEVENLSLTDASGNELKPESRQNTLGLGDDGSMMVELYSHDAPKGSWVAVKGDMLVTKSAGAKTQPAKKVSKGAETKVELAGGSITYSISEEGELVVAIKGASAIEKIADFVFTSADGKELESNGSYSSATKSMMEKNFIFENPVTELNVAVQTYEDVKNVTLPMNFRVGMSGMLSAEPKKAASAKDSKAKSSTKRKKR